MTSVAVRDISILEIGDGVFEVPSKWRHPRRNSRIVLINFLIEEFKKEQGIDLRSDKMALQRLKEEGEKAKSHFLQRRVPTLTCLSSQRCFGPKHLNRLH